MFNTAITRAESLVVAVGNPILLLKTEKHMIKDPKYKQRGKCWSNYLKHCIEHNTISFSVSLEEDREIHLANIRTLVEDQLSKPIVVCNSKDVLTPKAGRGHVTPIYHHKFRHGSIFLMLAVAVAM